MRDPDRIERILVKFADAWSWEDQQRMGQFFYNLLRFPFNADIFFIEDTRLEEVLDKYLNEKKASIDSSFDPYNCVNSEEHPQFGILECDCSCHKTDESCKISCKPI